MGVSGSGKSTIAQMLAEALKIKYADADDFHPSSNIQKMQAGFPLNDEDRSGWLQAIHQFVEEELEKNSVVIACSALKEAYRQILSKDLESVWIYLKGNFELIQSRMQARDHFMPPSLLQSQFDALEEPKDAIVLDIKKPARELLQELLQSLK